MKTKKKTKKNHATRNGTPYSPGRNVFGEKAETHLIVVKRETAFEQIMDAICQLDGSTKEFTFDMSCFKGHEEELDAVMTKVQIFIEMKAKMLNKPLFDCSDCMEDVA